MRDEEIRQEFIRVNRPGNRLEVMTISWDGHTPTSTWVLFEELPDNAGPAEIEAAMDRALTSKLFFNRCHRCEQIKPLGWMHDSKVCQGCAERYDGVVH